VNRAKRAQAERCASVIEKWIAASPGRSIDVERAPGGWKATMREERSAGGVDLIDCLSQIAVVAEVETST
jgi:hypothetical protein